jgi:hypothetical protein
MTQKSSSQPQHENPFAGALEAQMARAEAFAAEMQKLEREAIERATEAVDEMARLTKETLEHTTRLTAEWRKMSMDAMKRSADFAKSVGRPVV